MPLATHRAAYVVLSHRDDQALISRLVGSILHRSPSAKILVFHDSRSSAPPNLRDERVTVVPHMHRADWGSWEIVKATMEALKLVSESFDPDMVTLISGQDYPINSLENWERSFISSGYSWAGNARPIDYRAKWGRLKGEGERLTRRYTFRWYRLPFSRSILSSNRPATYLRRVLGLLNEALEPVVAVDHMRPGRGTHVGFRDPFSPVNKDVQCYYGSQWLVMDRRALERVLFAHKENGRLRRAYMRSLIPDESYIQTILNKEVGPPADSAVSFYRWDETRSHPVILVADDYELITRSRAPFCRKVSLPESLSLLDRLDSV